MANTSYTQQALAADPQFAIRVRAQLITQALVVLVESGGTPNHAIRVTFAKQVLQDSNRETVRISPILVTRTNLMAFTTSYDFPSGDVVTAAGDADILSQLASDWDIFAGV